MVPFPPPCPAVRSLQLQRLLLAILPAVLLGSIAATTIWGQSGVFTRRTLQEELVEAREEVAEVQRENQRLLWELRAMERDPVVVERMVADELLWGSEGATLYRFDDAAADRSDDAVLVDRGVPSEYSVGP